MTSNISIELGLFALVLAFLLSQCAVSPEQTRRKFTIVLPVGGAALVFLSALVVLREAMEFGGQAAGISVEIPEVLCFNASLFVGAPALLLGFVCVAARFVVFPYVDKILEAGTSKHLKECVETPMDSADRGLRAKH